MKPFIIPVMHELTQTIEPPGLIDIALVERLHLSYGCWSALTCHNMLYPEFHAVPGEPAKGLAHCLLSVE